VNHQSSEQFTPEDLDLYADLRAGNAWLRSVLTTLARRGVAFRRDHPERAQAWLDTLATFPYYKAGQFLFDLLEWEDFMLDEPATTLETALDPQAMRRLSALMRAIKAHVDGAAELTPATSEPELLVTVATGDLPPLEPGFYLFPDVVLGILGTALPFRKPV
jgi:hypothetical protein